MQTSQGQACSASDSHNLPGTSLHQLYDMLQTFIDLCQQPVAEYLDRFNFKSPLLKSMYAVTDGFSGLNGSWQTPGTGMNFLMHNMVSVMPLPCSICTDFWSETLTQHWFLVDGCCTCPTHVATYILIQLLRIQSDLMSRLGEIDLLCRMYSTHPAQQSRFRPAVRAWHGQLLCYADAVFLCIPLYIQGAC